MMIENALHAIVVIILSVTIYIRIFYDSLSDTVILHVIILLFLIDAILKSLQIMKSLLLIRSCISSLFGFLISLAACI